MAFADPFRVRTVAVVAPEKVARSRDRTAASGRHLALIKAFPCACCGAPGPSEAHHIREGQGGAQRAPDWLAIPLCVDDHRGPRGVHGDRTAMGLRKLTELDMLANTIAVLMR